jgi:hypothetical protein
MKRAVYTRMDAAVVGPGKEDVAGAMRKYCDDDVEGDDANEEAGKEDNREWQQCGRIRGALQVIVVVAPAPPGRVATLRLAVLPVALSALAHVVVVDTGTFDARATEARVLVRPPEPDHISSSASHDSSAPATPTTPTTATTPRTHLFPRPHHPRSRAHFRTFSASIAARSPLSLSFPLSLSLPLSAHRARGAQRCINI